MKNKLFFSAGIILFLGLAYGQTLAPDFSWANGGADGGDLITATFVNGVPHPTGYPLYLILAKIFQWLPFGSVAFRTNLFSAICTISAAVLVFFTMDRLLIGRKYSGMCAFITAMLFGLAPIIWSQAVITEVYGLQSLLIVLILYQTFFPGKNSTGDIMRGLLFGLAIGNHVTTLLLFPLLIWDVIRHFRLPKLALRLLAILPGLLVYLALPLRAMNQPPVNWYNPVTLDSFLQLVSGKLYQSYFSTGYFFDRLRGWVGLLIENFSLPGIAVGIYALLGLKKEELKAIWPLIWIFISFGIFALIYSSYDSYVYLIPTMLVFAYWVGFGVSSLLNEVEKKWRRAGSFILPLLLVFLIYRGFIVVPQVDASKDNRAEAFAQEVLESVPDNALIFTNDDQATFTMWYSQYVTGQRPDTAIVVAGLLDFDWYQQSLRDTYPDLNVPADQNLALSHLISGNPDRPYCIIQSEKQPTVDCSR